MSKGGAFKTRSGLSFLHIGGRVSKDPHQTKERKTTRVLANIESIAHVDAVKYDDAIRGTLHALNGRNYG